MEHTCADNYTVQFLHYADTLRSGVVSKTRAREAVSVQPVNQALRSHGNGTHDGRVAIGTWPGTRGSGCLASYDTQGYSSICSLSCICTLLACLQGTGSNPPRTVLMNDTNDSNSNQATEYICKRSIANMPSPSPKRLFTQCRHLLLRHRNWQRPLLPLVSSTSKHSRCLRSDFSSQSFVLMFGLPLSVGRGSRLTTTSSGLQR